MLALQQLRCSAGDVPLEARCAPVRIRRLHHVQLISCGAEPVRQAEDVPMAQQLCHALHLVQLPKGLPVEVARLLCVALLQLICCC
jgi:hypothetical protein